MTVSGIAQQRLLIGGEWTDAESAATFETANPSTGEVATAAAAADAHRAVEAAAGALGAW